VNWRERQALPGPRARFFWASVFPQPIDGDTGKAVTAETKSMKLVWPKKGQGQTFRYHRNAPRPATRAQRETWRDFDVVDPVAA
jgi:hypothetical protein